MLRYANRESNTERLTAKKRIKTNKLVALVKGDNMQTVYISLPTVETVQRFVALISPLPGQFDLLSEEHILDAKSLMGIFKLDLTKPIKLRIEKDTKETMQVISHFMED
jgi:phosphotransferase system HPr-like phosphotransfer protein